MRHDGKDGSSAKDLRSAEHVVFDFTGLDQLDVGDLSLILTARLQSGPAEHVWVRSLPPQTARILRVLRLDHLFRAYPKGSEALH